MVRSTPSLIPLVSLLALPLLGCAANDDASSTDEIGNTSDDGDSSTSSSDGDSSSTGTDEGDSSTSSSDGDSTGTGDADVDTTEGGGSLCQSWADHLIECGAGGPGGLVVCEDWTQNAAAHGGDCPQLLETMLECVIATPCSDFNLDSCPEETDAAADCVTPP